MAKLYVEEICKHARIVHDPSYYSGRGATTSDLNDEILERAFNIIKDRVSENAAAAYVDMVAALPVASATGFLHGLYDLAANGWVWPEGKKGHNGIDPHNEQAAMGTVMSVLGRAFTDGEYAQQRQDMMTRQIRGSFLQRHGHKSDDAYDPWGIHMPELFDMPKKRRKRTG